MNEMILKRTLWQQLRIVWDFNHGSELVHIHRSQTLPTVTHINWNK